MGDVLKFKRPTTPVEEIETITEHLVNGEVFVERRVVNRDGLGFVSVRDDAGRGIMLRPGSTSSDTIRDLIVAWCSGRAAGRDPKFGKEWWSHG